MIDRLALKLVSRVGNSDGSEYLVFFPGSDDRIMMVHGVK